VCKGAAADDPVGYPLKNRAGAGIRGVNPRVDSSVDSVGRFGVGNWHCESCARGRRTNEAAALGRIFAASKQKEFRNELHCYRVGRGVAS
jgi:hypothetical protein